MQALTAALTGPWLQSHDIRSATARRIKEHWDAIADQLPLSPRTLMSVGTVFSLLAAAASCLFTLMTGASLWSLNADPAATWRYIVPMNLIYWNTWAPLVPPILIFTTRFPLDPGAWRRTLPWHVVGGFLFVGAHVLLVATGRAWLQRMFGMQPSWRHGYAEAYLRTLDWELTFYWGVVALGHALMYRREAIAAQSGRIRPAAPWRIAIPTDTGLTLLPLEEIAWIEAAGNYACIHAGSETHVIRESMKSLEARLGRAGFLRVHRTAIVNLHHVRMVETGASREATIRLNDGTRVPATRQSEARIRRMLETPGGTSS